jgi:uncharacterized membrane protein
LGKLFRSIEIATSPENVFNFIIDVDKMNEAHEGSVKANYTTEGPVGVGTKGHFVANVDGSHFEWDAEITEFEQNKRIYWTALSPDKMAIIFDVEPLPNGTKLTHSSEYELPYSVFGKLIDRFKVSKDLTKELTIFLDNVKKALETQAVITSTH